MYEQYLGMWTEFFKMYGMNMFNYNYNEMFKDMFQSADIRVGTDDDIIVMGDLTIVLPNNKKMLNSKKIKEELLKTVKATYKQNPQLFERDENGA